MATRAQLMDALRRADAAGDVEAARAIARKLASAPQDQASQPDRAAGVSLSDLITGKRPEPQGSTLGNLGSGAWQGIKDTAIGIGQLGARGGPMAGAYNVAEALGLVNGNPAASAVDQVAQDSAADWQANPASQSLSGKAGQFVGSVAATAPLGALSIPAKGATWGANAMRAAGAGAAGAVTQPADPDNFAAEKAKQAGIGGLLGGALSAGLTGGQRALESLVPSNATANILNMVNRKANASQFADEGEALASRTGVQLSPGAISGGKAQTMVENAARQSVFSRDLAFEADQRTAQQISDYIGRTLDGVRKSGESPAVVGERVRGAVSNAVNRVVQQRQTQAAKDYGAIERMTQGKLTLQLDGYEGKLKELITEFGAAPKGSDQGKIAGALNDLLNQSSVARRPEKLMQTRRFLSQIAGGKANIAGETGRGIQISTAKSLLRALDDDLDANADQLGGNVGEMLRRANANYRGYSQQIEAIEASPLGRLLGEEFAADGVQAFNKIPPEKVVDRLRRLEPTEVGVVRSIVEKQDPDAWASMKRRFLEDAFEAAQQSAPSDGANALAIRGNTFVNQLAKTTKDQERLRALYSPRELAEINDAFDVIRRWNDKTGYNFSGTAAQSEVLGLMNSLRDVALRGSASVAGQVLGARSVAKLMNDQAGRRALLQLKRLPPGSDKARQLAAVIAGIVVGGSAGQPEQGEQGQGQGVPQ